MRVLVFLVFVVTSSGCSGLMLGGGSATGSTAQESRTTSAQTADMATSKRVREKFAADAELSKHKINVSTTAGMVRLSGSVSGYAVRENAEKMAMASAGVKAVDNQITVKYLK